jgi:hypothetical protein
MDLAAPLEKKANIWLVVRSMAGAVSALSAGWSKLDHYGIYLCAGAAATTIVDAPQKLRTVRHFVGE